MQQKTKNELEYTKVIYLYFSVLKKFKVEFTCWHLGRSFLLKPMLYWTFNTPGGRTIRQSQRAEQALGWGESLVPFETSLNTSVLAHTVANGASRSKASAFPISDEKAVSKQIIVAIIEIFG